MLLVESTAGLMGMLTAAVFPALLRLSRPSRPRPFLDEDGQPVPSPHSENLRRPVSLRNPTATNPKESAPDRKQENRAPQLCLGLACLTVWIAANGWSQPCALTPLTPNEPLRVQEGEAAIDSDSFQAGQMALGPNDQVYFADATGRIRTIDPGGRLRTLAGNGKRSSAVQPGPALQTPMPFINQVKLSPTGVVHFSATGRIYRIEDGAISVVAGSGRSGFNGESGPAVDLNLGNIVNFAFDSGASLYIVDSFLRVRRLDPDGVLRTFAGSSNPFEFGGLNGEGGPATRASLLSPRQVIPLRDGTVWIREFRSLLAVGLDGNVSRLNDNLDPQAEILLTPNGDPVLASLARVIPLGLDGRLTQPALFAGFTGNPRALGRTGLYAINSRADVVTGLFRWTDGQTSVLIAGAPRRPPTSGTSSEPFGVWVDQTASLIYRGTLDGVSGLIEARPGQAPRLLAGRGTDTGDPEGKPLSSLAIAGVIGFTIDNTGRLVLLDATRSRVLTVESSGNVTSLKDASQQAVSLGPIAGSLSNPQRLAVDAAGNIYWMLPTTPGPFGGPRARVFIWTRSTSNVSSYTVDGLDAIVRQSNGFVAGIAGPTGVERSLRRLEATQIGPLESGLEELGIQSVATVGSSTYFASFPSLFHGRTGAVEAFTEQFSSPTEPDRPLAVFFVAGSSSGLVLRTSDNAFYRLPNPDACPRVVQPRVLEGGVVSAAGYGYPDTVSHWQLVTVFGSGLGPPGGVGITLDGTERATFQPGAYPSLLLGQRQPSGALGGIQLPVVFANESQMTVQVPFVPTGFDILFWSWNGLLLKYPRPIRTQTTTPGVFVQGAARDGAAAALNQDNQPNSAQRPAARGSLVQFFLTGLGGTLPPPSGPGAFNDTTVRQRLLEPVTVRVGGITAAVDFAVAAPGYIAGLYQVTVRIPANAPVGVQPVEFVSAGQSTSRFQQVTVSVE